MLLEILVMVIYITNFYIVTSFQENRFVLDWKRGDCVGSNLAKIIFIKN